MIHVTATIGLALAFLIESMAWSVAPVAGVVLAGGLLAAVIVRVAARRRRR